MLYRAKRSPLFIIWSRTFGTILTMIASLTVSDLATAHTKFILATYSTLAAL